MYKNNYAGSSYYASAMRDPQGYTYVRTYIYGVHMGKDKILVTCYICKMRKVAKENSPLYF